MKKETIKNMVGLVVFYSLIILRVLILNARFEYLNNQNSSNDKLSLKN